MNLGTGFINRSELDSGVFYMFKGIELLVQTSSNSQQTLIAGYGELGRAYSTQENYPLANYYAFKALELSKGYDRVDEASMLNNIGEYYRLDHKLDSAKHYFLQALPIFDSLEVEIGVAYVEGNIGLVYAEKGEYDLAETYITRSIATLDSLEDFQTIAVYDMYMAAIYAQRGEAQRAFGYATKSYEVAKKYDYREQLRDAALKLSELHRESGNFEQAFGYQSEYLVYRDSINSEETIRKMGDLRTNFEVTQKQLEVDKARLERDRQEVLTYAVAIVAFLVAALASVLYLFYHRQKKTSERLAEQKEEIESQRDQLEILNGTKDHFFKIISHDLRGPIGTVISLIYILKDAVEEGDKDMLTEGVNMVDTASRQSMSLIDDLLNWAMTQQGSLFYKPNYHPTEKIIDTVYENYRITAETKAIELIKEVEAPGLKVWADYNSVNAIIRNLVNNAIKFTPKGGQIRLGAKAPGRNSVVLVVKDTGGGIPEHLQAGLFDSDEQASTDGTAGEKGTGLGLVMCKDFTLMNHGKIWVESEMGQGTAFFVELPSYEVK